MKVLRAYTDGSCVNQVFVNDPNKPRFAGIGVFFTNNPDFNISEVFQLDNPTNNRAELFATYKAMEIMYEHYCYLRENMRPNELKHYQYQIYTDNQLVIDTYVGSKYRAFACMWKPVNWKPGDGANGWVKKDGSIPANLDLIVPGYELYCKFPGNLKILKVKAHRKTAGTDDTNSIEYKKWYGNMMADKFATEASESARNKFLAS